MLQMHFLLLFCFQSFFTYLYAIFTCIYSYVILVLTEYDSELWNRKVANLYSKGKVVATDDQF